MAVRISAGWVGPFYYRPENLLVINYVLPKLYPSGGSVILPVCFRRFHCKCWIQNTEYGAYGSIQLHSGSRVKHKVQTDSG